MGKGLQMLFFLGCSVCTGMHGPTVRLWLAQDARGSQPLILWSQVPTAFLLRSSSNQAWFVVFCGASVTLRCACVRECEVALANEHSHWDPGATLGR